MNLLLKVLRSPLIGLIATDSTHLFNLPCFPPPDDFVVSTYKNGQPLSKYSSENWDFREIERDAFFNFESAKLSQSNLADLKAAFILVLLHPKLFPGQVKSCRTQFTLLRNMAKVCEAQSIRFREVYKFPNIYPEIYKCFPKAKQSTVINFLHRLAIHGSEYDIGVVNTNLLKFLSRQSQNSEPVQRAYIPPRIWSYQLGQTKACIEDFLQHKNQIKAAFEDIANAYEFNTKLKNSALGKNINFSYLSPFSYPNIYAADRKVYPGGFAKFLDDRRLTCLFKKWLGEEADFSLRAFSRYLTLVRDMCILNIMNFSLQRLNEACSLRSDCFHIEKDNTFGEIAYITGETTKTDVDSDARWIVPKEVGLAVEVAAFIATLRGRYLVDDSGRKLPASDSLPLLLAPLEPWIYKGDRGGVIYKSEREEPISHFRYGPFITHNSQVFDADKIIITPKDWDIAIALTPNLELDPRFRVGLPWKFSAHQLRRTTCVNMFSSNLVSATTLQWSLKHLSRKMTLYYGRNYTNLRLNSDATSSVLVEGYRATYKQLMDVVNDSSTYIRPHKKDMIAREVISLIDANNQSKLMKMIKKGNISCRSTLLGMCMKSGPCEYGGIESVSHCAIGDGGGICVDAIFDKSNSSNLIKLKATHQQKLSTLDPNSPSFKALKKEIRALEVYLNVCDK